MSVCCDASIEENPENIVKHWRDSFEELHKEATAFPDGKHYEFLVQRTMLVFVS